MCLYDKSPAGKAALEKYRANARWSGMPILVMTVGLLGGVRTQANSRTLPCAHVTRRAGPQAPLISPTI